MSHEPTFEKTPFPLINIQKSVPNEETYYGRFRGIIKQRFFGIKLEEVPFMEFVDSNPDTRNKLEEFVFFMDKVKDDYISFLRKNYPDKLEKKKKKKKGKKKDSGMGMELQVPRADSEGFSSENSALFSSRDELEAATTSNELVTLRTKIESIKNGFVFDSIENVAKNIHLFDDFFGKIKAEHTNRTHMNQLKQLQLLNFGVGASEGGIGIANLGTSAENGDDKQQDLPGCFEYFDTLYKRWDEFNPMMNDEDDNDADDEA